MIELFGKGKQSKIEEAAERHARLTREIEALEAEWVAAHAKALEAEDLGKDPRAAEKILADLDKRLELKRAARQAAEAAGLAAAAEDANRRLENLPKAESDLEALAREVAVEAFRGLYVSCAALERLGHGELARAIHENAMAREVFLGVAGAKDAHGGPRAAGAALARAEIEAGVLPDLVALRSEVNSLRAMGPAQQGASSPWVRGAWKRALNEKNRAAGIRFDPFRSWQKKEQARRLEGRV